MLAGMDLSTALSLPAMLFLYSLLPCKNLSVIINTGKVVLTCAGNAENCYNRFVTIPTGLGVHGVGNLLFINTERCKKEIVTVQIITKTQTKHTFSA